MRVVGLISGGKDSCFNMMQCVAKGHEIVALANLHPQPNDDGMNYYINLRFTLYFVQVVK